MIYQISNDIQEVVVEKPNFEKGNITMAPGLSEQMVY